MSSKSDIEKPETSERLGIESIDCSHDFIPRLPGKPTKEEIMWQLERMIHQWDDSPRPESAQGYHRDALWLEEVRHIIHKQEKERMQLAKLSADTPQFYNPMEAIAAKNLRDDILANAQEHL